MALTTRPPTGKPAWPIVLLAGLEKKGKSWAAAEASASGMVGRTFWIGCGEDAPDEYGNIPGARFEIVEHDGTHKSMITALRDAIAEPKADGKPNLIVVDSAGRWWGLLSELAQEAATRRAQKSAAKYNKAFDPDDDATVHPDLWNAATSKWYDVVDLLRSHDGPVILTSLLALQVVMDNAGKPTKDKEWKIKAQKSLAADVGVVVEIPDYKEFYVTGIRSTRREPVKTGEHNDDTRFADFSIEKLWTVMGLDGDVGPRNHDSMNTGDTGVAELLTEVSGLAKNLDTVASVVADWAESHGGQSIGDASDAGGLEILRDDLAEQVRLRDAAPAPTPTAAPAVTVQGTRHGPTQVVEPVPAVDPAGWTGAQVESIIIGQAQVLRVNPKQHVAPLVAAQVGATSVRELPLALVVGFLNDQGPSVAGVMLQRGFATQAAAYQSAMKDGRVGTWDELTTPPAMDEQDRADTPVAAPAETPVAVPA